ncbi:hypothetical protein FACS18945_3680 [Bacteroidia bacterium]|nr:hypothetical protein FACS18945_3680 [Bacteroidia bacterium]
MGNNKTSSLSFNIKDLGLAGDFKTVDISKLANTALRNASPAFPEFKVLKDVNSNRSHFYDLYNRLCHSWVYHHQRDRDAFVYEDLMTILNQPQIFLPFGLFAQEHMLEVRARKISNQGSYSQPTNSFTLISRYASMKIIDPIANAAEEKYKNIALSSDPRQSQTIERVFTNYLDMVFIKKFITTFNPIKLFGDGLNMPVGKCWLYDAISDTNLTTASFFKQTRNENREDVFFDMNDATRDIFDEQFCEILWEAKKSFRIPLHQKLSHLMSQLSRLVAVHGDKCYGKMQTIIWSNFLGSDYVKKLVGVRNDKELEKLGDFYSKDYIKQAALKKQEFELDKAIFTQKIKIPKTPIQYMSSEYLVYISKYLQYCIDVLNVACRNINVKNNKLSKDKNLPTLFPLEGVSTKEDNISSNKFYDLCEQIMKIGARNLEKAEPTEDALTTTIVDDIKVENTKAKNNFNKIYSKLYLAAIPLSEGRKQSK